MAKIELEMQGDKVIVVPNPVEEKTAGGIYIPDTAKERPAFGIVVAVGTDTEGTPMAYKVDQEVMFLSKLGIPFEFNGQDCVLLKQGEIIGPVTRK